MSRILVTGGTGQVGGQLRHTLAPLGEIVTPGRAELDLADADSLVAYMQRMKPRWVVNAGAYTAVDRAEAEPELAEAINAMAPRVLAEQSRLLGAAMIHFSTDYVFDGCLDRPYVETDATGPLGVYGATKLVGERAVLEATDAAMILRTSWVYGATGKNFLRTMLRLAREREEVRVVADQQGTPTWSRDLAELAAHLIAHTELAAAGRGQTLAEAAAASGGIYHASAAGETTWHGFASEALGMSGHGADGARPVRVVPIGTSEYPTPARRPANSRLNCGKLRETFAWTMPEWRESLGRVLGEADFA